MTNKKRPVGRPPFTKEERAQREATDTHLRLPNSLIEDIDAVRLIGESRKDCIVRLLQEHLKEK